MNIFVSIKKYIFTLPTLPQYIVMLTERGWVRVLWERLANARYCPRDDHDADELARAERVYVANAIALRE